MMRYEIDMLVVKLQIFLLFYNVLYFSIVVYSLVCYSDMEIKGGKYLKDGNEDC